MIGAAALVLLGLLPGQVIVAEGERFRPLDGKGWRITPQDESYASMTFGGMWMTHGACLGAPAESVGSVAVQEIKVESPGAYRVWSKYQAPPYFDYPHRIEVRQGNKVVFAHVYGRKGTKRMFSFGAYTEEAWWSWGVDHDAAEAPAETAPLAKGMAEVRLITMAGERPIGDRYVDFVLLTKNLADDYRGFKPNTAATPFLFEALDATHLYLRYKNTAAAPASLTLSRLGHVQPSYARETTRLPPQGEVAPGAFSAWLDFGPFCRLVTEEGIFVELPGAQGKIPIEFARDERGLDRIGEVELAGGQAFVVPIDVTWKKTARIRSTRSHAESLARAAKSWRTANGGKKPKSLLFYGAFVGDTPWIAELKDALGFNTALPDRFEHVAKDGVYTHAPTLDDVRKVAADREGARKLRVLSFGDEIVMDDVDISSPEAISKFRAWLERKRIDRRDLGADPGAALPAKSGTGVLAWWSQRFIEEEQAEKFHERLDLARKLIAPDILAGANFSPHHLVLYYGPLAQWIDLFRADGMSLYWTEDYIFVVPEVPEMVSWMLAEMRAAVRERGQPMRFYVLPHSPGQDPAYWRRNALLSVGTGVQQIDTFLVAPLESLSENYVDWHHPEMFRALHEAIFDSAEVEKLALGGKQGPAHVALVLSRATEFQETRSPIDKAKDPFFGRCGNAPDKIAQMIDRREQQMLYLALRRAQVAVDLITEGDVADRDVLPKYDVVYFAGEWIDRRAAEKLADWVASGGVLYAAAGAGLLDEIGEPLLTMHKLLGVRSAKLDKRAIGWRTRLELPLLEPFDAIHIGGDDIPAVVMRQAIEPNTAAVMGRWKNGEAAVTANRFGRGRAFTVGTVPGTIFMKSGLGVVPGARAGKKAANNPGGSHEFDEAAAKLVRLGIEARPRPKEVETSPTGVETVLVEHPEGLLLTLVNWTNAKIEGLAVTVRSERPIGRVRSVALGRELPLVHDKGSGAVSFRLDLADADFVVLAPP